MGQLFPEVCQIPLGNHSMLVGGKSLTLKSGFQSFPTLCQRPSLSWRQATEISLNGEIHPVKDGAYQVWNCGFK